MATEDSQQTSEQLVELLIYAPVGIALEALDNFPKFVERGKSQVTLARFFAKAAARKGSKSVESVAEGVLNDAAQVLVDLFGIDLTADNEQSHKAPPADDKTSATSPNAKDRTDSDSLETDGGLEHFIDGYDNLSAREIIVLLDSLSEAQLSLVAEYEAENRNRVTIQRKIEQLLTT